MGLAQALRAVVDQFGGARDDYDDYDDYDDDALTGPSGYERDEAPRRARGGSADYDDIYRGEPLRRSPSARERDVRPLSLVRPPRLGFSLVSPQDFDAAQQIADHLRADGLVIVDLESCGQDLAKRLTDFCSGLTYALEGSLQHISEQVLLLAPHNVELSSESSGGLRERRFFNRV
jgi:cell division inhibitor SepF